jgi:hypothetical protein
VSRIGIVPASKILGAKFVDSLSNLRSKLMWRILVFFLASGSEISSLTCLIFRRKRIRPCHLVSSLLVPAGSKTRTSSPIWSSLFFVFLSYCYFCFSDAASRFFLAYWSIDQSMSLVEGRSWAGRLDPKVWSWPSHCSFRMPRGSLGLRPYSSSKRMNLVEACGVSLYAKTTHGT